jgi:hypothetical protein
VGETLCSVKECTPLALLIFCRGGIKWKLFSFPSTIMQYGLEKGECKGVHIPHTGILDRGKARDSSCATSPWRTAERTTLREQTAPSGLIEHNGRPRHEQIWRAAFRRGHMLHAQFGSTIPGCARFEFLQHFAPGGLDGLLRGG